MASDDDVDSPMKPSPSPSLSIGSLDVQTLLALPPGVIDQGVLKAVVSLMTIKGMTNMPEAGDVLRWRVQPSVAPELLP